MSSPPSPPFPTAQSESSPALPPRRPRKTVQGPCPCVPACGLFAARSHCVGCGVWKRAGSGVRGAGARALQHRARPPAAAGGSVEPCAAFPSGPSEFWPCDPRPSDRSVSRLALLGVVSAERRLGAPPVRGPAGADSDRCSRAVCSPVLAGPRSHAPSTGSATPHGGGRVTRVLGLRSAPLSGRDRAPRAREAKQRPNPRGAPNYEPCPPLPPLRPLPRLPP